MGFLQASHEECDKQFLYFWQSIKFAHSGDEESNSPTKLSCMLAFSLISSDTDFFQPPHFQGSLCSSTWVVFCLSGKQPNYTSLFLIPQGTLKSHHSFSRAFPFQTTPFPSTLYIAGQPRSEIYLPSPHHPHHFCEFFLEGS